MAWTIRFYHTTRGESPTEEFLDSLDEKPRAKCVSYMDLLEEHGYTLSRNYAALVEDGIYELRPEWGGIEYRFFYFFGGDNLIYIVHAIIKKTQRLQKADIQPAKKRRDE